MIRRILAPIDGSPASDSALRIAASLAGLTDAQLVGLFVEDEMRFLKSPSLASAIAEGLQGQSAIPVPLDPKAMLEQEDRTAAEVADLKQRFHVCLSKSGALGEFVNRRGDPAELIIRYAKTVDFVVLGNLGKHSGVEGKRRGITTSALVHATTRPVLVVPEEPLGESIMVCAYDGSMTAERALRAAAEFAEVSDFSEFHLLSVFDDEAEAREIQAPAMEYLRGYDFEVTAVNCAGKVAKTIGEYAREISASVVSLGAFGSHRRAERIFGSTTNSVLQDVEMAVLLVA